jgi:glycosyltransferase involved in cell wall biosynthesis
MSFRVKSAVSRIGIVHPEIAGWMGGLRYIRTLEYALGNACQSAGTELYILREQKSSEGQTDRLPAKVVPIADCFQFPGEWRVRLLLGLPERSGLIHAAREHGISVLLPLQTVPFRASDIKTICWIPDFQHVHLPELFSEKQRRSRDVTFERMARRCTLMLLSSRNALEHFADAFPQHVHKARLARFPSLFAFEPPSGDSKATIQKFNLPEKFALVANQFWRHKNHEVVIEAIRQLHRKGIQVPLVMTGLPIDHRDRNNETTTRILQAIASAGLNRYVTVLGVVDDTDFGNLMRAASVIIQPSRFEGWSTTIQDSKALGRPLICSDIAVHREQVKEAVGYFRCDRPDELADLLAQNWPKFNAGPDARRETCGLAAEQEFARTYGDNLLQVCKEAVGH